MSMTLPNFRAQESETEIRTKTSDNGGEEEYNSTDEVLGYFKGIPHSQISMTLPNSRLQESETETCTKKLGNDKEDEYNDRI